MQADSRSRERCIAGTNPGGNGCMCILPVGKICANTSGKGEKMATCKNCIHYKVCKRYGEVLGTRNDVDAICEDFEKGFTPKKSTIRTEDGKLMLNCSVCEYRLDGCSMSKCKWRLVRLLAEYEEKYG